MKLTASKLHIVEKCPAAAALPEAPTEAGAPALYGTAIHAYVEAVGREANRLGEDGHDADPRVVLADARGLALEKTAPEYREACEAIDVDKLPLGGTWRHEVGYALNVKTGAVRFLGEGLAHADLGVDDEEELAGIFDLEGHQGEDLVTILDTKTGWSVLPPAIRSMQLKLGAVCAAEHHRATSAMVGHLFLRQGQRPWYDAPEEPADAFTLAAWKGELIALHERCMAQRRQMEAIERKGFAPGGPLSYAIGSQCKFCPVKLHCEAQTKLVRLMANKPVTLADFIKEGLTTATAAQAIVRLEVLQAAINTAWEALYAYAGEHPVETEDGRWLRKGVKTRKVFVEDGEKSHSIAAKALTGAIGAELAMKAFKLSASQKRIEEVARTIVKQNPEGAATLLPPGAKKVSIAGVKAGLLGRIEEAGGFAEVSKEVVDFFRTASGNESDES